MLARHHQDYVDIFRNVHIPKPLICEGPKGRSKDYEILDLEPKTTILMDVWWNNKF